MPADNSSTVAAGEPIPLPREGPALGGITRISAAEFVLPDIATVQA